MKTQQISLSLKSTYEDFFRFWGPGDLFKEIVFAKKKGEIQWNQVLLQENVFAEKICEIQWNQIRKPLIEEM